MPPRPEQPQPDGKALRQRLSGHIVVLPIALVKTEHEFVLICAEEQGFIKSVVVPDLLFCHVHEQLVGLFRRADQRGGAQTYAQPALAGIRQKRLRSGQRGDGGPAGRTLPSGKMQGGNIAGCPVRMGDHAVTGIIEDVARSSLQHGCEPGRLESFLRSQQVRFGEIETPAAADGAWL